MRLKQGGPCGMATDTALNDSWQRSSYPLHRDSQVRCELHDVCLVHKFPPRCPLGTRNPLATLGALQDLAWGELGILAWGDSGRSEALHVLDDVDACLRCLGSALPSATVRRLRAGMGLAA